MNISPEHKPLVQEKFRGLYSRGLADTVPDSFFIDTLNTKFDGIDVLTRDGLSLNIVKANIRRAFVYKRLGETPRQIILDTAGNLFDSLAPGVPIWTDALMVDFSMININNRAYITPHNRIKGIASKSLLVYEGSGSARLAAGVPPTGFTLAAANSATSGKVEAGYHLFAVCNITSSGFITAPGPAIFAILNTPGARKVDLSGIAVGGAGVVGRLIVATKSILTTLYNGNQYGWELFFVPSAVINDNVSTTLTVDFFDADLIDSADYLIDNLSTVPAGLGLCSYSGRLVSWGENGNQFTARVSEPLQPEVFSSVDGFITIDGSDAESGIKNAAPYRNKLLLATSNRWYSTSDNDSAPSTWNVGDAIDKSSGTECFGIATVLDARGSNTDRLWFADKSGLISFEGYARRPELTWNIENIWKRINKAVFNLIQVVDDPSNHRIMITVPLDAATAISHVLYGDYSDAFTVYGTIDEKAIKWSIWTFPSAPVSMMGDTDAVTKASIIHLALSGGNTYDLKQGVLSDDGNAIDSYVKLSLKTAALNWINHFGGIKLRANGSGILQVTLFGEDDILSQTLLSPTLAALPGQEYDLLANFKNEKCSMKFRVSNFGEFLRLHQVTLFARPLWLRRPG